MDHKHPYNLVILSHEVLQISYKLTRPTKRGKASIPHFLGMVDTPVLYTTLANAHRSKYGKAMVSVPRISASVCFQGESYMPKPTSEFSARKDLDSMDSRKRNHEILIRMETGSSVTATENDFNDLLVT